MLKIYIIRHGQDKDNLAGVLNGHRNQSLTEKGIEQAHETANKIKAENISFDKILSSPLNRAFETAEIVAKVNNFPLPEKEPLLIERNFGIMTGQKIVDIEMLCQPDILKTDTIVYFLNPEGAETFPEMMIRAQKLLDKIQGEYKDGSILLATHGDMGKMIYAQYYGLDWKQTLNQFSFGNCDLLLLSEDSPADQTHVFKVQQHNA